MRNALARAIPVLALSFALTGCGGPETKSTNTNGSIVSKGLDAQDFTAAASESTNEMLAAPRVQERLKSIQAQLPPGQLPLIKINRIQNDTGLKINLVNYFVTPIEQVLVNSGKADTVSEDKGTRAAAAGQDILNGTQPRIAELTLYGVVSKLSTSNGHTDQNVYTFQLRMADSRTGSNVFVVQPRQIVKQTR